ncbi:MAG: cation diffusion facilitator family transporter, partial [Candidatus Hermodarchaeota archaeon]|nr:cation diffusion facilitator family transporter [Candidatus Hermodarchaeota archaeon]
SSKDKSVIPSSVFCELIVEMTGPKKPLSKQLRRAQRAIKWAVIVVTILAVISLSTALFSGSVGLLAKGIDSFKDIVAIVTVLFSLWLTQRTPTRRYPYGYFKAETLAALVIAVLIFLTGISVILQAIQLILQPTGVLNITLPLLVSISALPVTFILSWHLKRIGREAGSEAVYNTGQEFQTDILTIIAVIIGLVLTFVGLPWAEPVVGFIIGLIILKNSLQLIYDSVLTLMDAVRNPEQIKHIEKLVQPIEGVLGVHDIKVRKAGPIYFGEMHLEVAGKLTVLKAHRITEEVENRIQEVYPNILSFLVHIEPIIPTTFRLAFPVDQPTATPESRPSKHFGSVNYFIIMDIDSQTISLWEVIPNPAADQNRQRGRNTAMHLIDARVDVVIAEKMGETPLSILRNHLISVYKQNSSLSCKENLQAYMKNELPYLQAQQSTPHAQREEPE